MNVKVKLNKANIIQLENSAYEALLLTAEAIKGNLQDSRTMPFDTGALQNRSTFVKGEGISKRKVRIVSDTPYARRLYFHPEYNFSKRENSNAGGEWFEPYINGEKKEYPKKVFVTFMRSKMR